MTWTTRIKRAPCSVLDGFIPHGNETIVKRKDRESVTHSHEYTLYNVYMPISNPEVKAGDETDGVIGQKKRRVSLKPG